MKVLERIFNRPTVKERIAATGFVRPPNTPLGRSGWVIVRPSITGTPTHWFRYHPSEQWVWTTNKNRAELFPDRLAAERALTNSTASYTHRCEIQSVS